MAIYVKKNKADILRSALRKIESNTSVRSTGPGSVARAFAESITTEIGDLYDALDFNLAQSVLSTASGRALDLIGSLYGVTRRTLTDLATIDAQVGNFYFYIESPHNEIITIPSGTLVYSSASDSFVGNQLSFVTTEVVTIPVGRTRVFTSIRPNYSDSVFTAGAGTLTIHSFVSPIGKPVRCTNPKPIAPQPGYEQDDEFRVRIIKSIRVSSSGTNEAVRFAALGVFGVRDAKIRTTPYGLGSFEIIVTPEDNNIVQTVLTNATEVVNRVRPVGVRMFVKAPETTPMDVSASLILAPGLTTQDVSITSNRVRNTITRYLNTLLPGSSLVYNRLIQEILDTSDVIRDVQITKYAPNGIETLRRNLTTAEDEQIIPGRIEVTVA